jgi:glycosyltransferase involved in cell wall biosynthesis
MYFGPARATSIDLCVRDLVGASRHRQSTRILAEQADDIFPGFEVEHLPSRGRAATFHRANSAAKAARLANPDIIVVQQHLPTAAAVARRLPGAKIILHTHNIQKGYGAGGIEPFIHRLIRKRRYGLLSGIIHVSQACADRFAEFWPDIALPSAVVNNGLDFASWLPARARAREVLCVGRCAPEKGILEAAQGLAASLPEFPDWTARFILSDTGVHREYFASVGMALSPLGARARIEMQRPFAEVKAAFERAAIALVPSKWVEPFGRTALEAHAGGAALISSGSGGLSEISGDTALILKSVEARAIAEAVRMLIVNDGARGSLALAGYRRVREKFDIQTQAARLDTFCEAVGGAAAPFLSPAGRSSEGATALMSLRSAR